MAASNDDLLDRIFLAVERNDVATIESIYADDIRIWHAHDGVVKSTDPNTATLAGLHLLGTLKYDILEPIHSGSRVAQRHELVITPSDGAQEYRLSAAIFITVENGKITEFQEYMDSRQLGIIGSAIERAMKAAVPAG